MDMALCGTGSLKGPCVLLLTMVCLLPLALQSLVYSVGRERRP